MVPASLTEGGNVLLGSHETNLQLGVCKTINPFQMTPMITYDFEVCFGKV
jgi:hypothetical protein